MKWVQRQDMPAQHLEDASDYILSFLQIILGSFENVLLSPYDQFKRLDECCVIELLGTQDRHLRIFMQNVHSVSG